jgi:ferrous iron transport protein A
MAGSAAGREAARVSVVPLSQVPVGGHVLIRSLRGGAAFIGRMAAMGFSIGTEVTVLRNPARGPLIVMVRSTRVALGRGEADKVLTETARSER